MMALIGRWIEGEGLAFYNLWTKQDLHQDISDLVNISHNNISDI